MKQHQTLKSSVEAAPIEMVQMALQGVEPPNRQIKSFIQSGQKNQSTNLNADISSNISHVMPKPRPEQNITPNRSNSPANNHCDEDEGIDESVDLSSVNMQSMVLR